MVVTCVPVRLHCRLKPVNAAVQYVPRDMSEADAQAVWEGEGLQAFLAKVSPRSEQLSVVVGS